SPVEFVKDILTGADSQLIEEYSKEMEEIVSHPSLFLNDKKTLDICCRWDAFCHELFHAYQDCALAEVEAR
ncbi:MAG: acyl-CoA dehydrogenase, partial [Spirochaetota bacterium]